MHASFDRHELTASRVERGKNALEPSRLAAAPTEELGLDLAATLASVKARSAFGAAAVENSDPPPWRARALSRLRRTFASPAVLFIIGALVVSAGYFVVTSALVEREAAAPPQKLDPPTETAALGAVEPAPASPSPEASVAQPAEPAPQIPSADGVEKPSPRPERHAKAKPGKVAQPAEPAPRSHSADKVEKPSARSDRHAKAKPEKLAKPAEPAPRSASADKAEKPSARSDRHAKAKPEKHAKLAEPAPRSASADKAEKPSPRADRHAKEKPVKLAKPRGAPRAPEPPGDPNVLSQAQEAVGSITGAFKGWAAGLDSGAGAASR